MDSQPLGNTASTPINPPSSASQPVPVQPVKKTNWPMLTLWLIPALIVLLVGGVFLSLQLFREQTTSPEEDVAGPNVKEIIDRGSLIIGTDGTFAPMEYIDDTGVLTGYDIDLGNRLAAEMGVTADFRNIAWDDLFTSLENNEIDMIISSVTITDERKQQYAFSEPYINAGQVIITNKNNNTIGKTSDLSGQKIGVQKETTNELEALKYTQEELVIRYDDFEQATNALIQGDVDAIFSDLTNAKGIVKDNPTLKIASDPFTSEYYGVVIRKQEEDLVTEGNRALNLLQQRGILTLLKQKWLE